MTIFQNYPLVASICSILFAQFVKFPIAYFSKKPDAHVSLVTSTGGMPSSHSAAVSSLITALIIEYGFTSPLVAIATTFGLIVMFDAMAVRRQSGEQGILLQKLYEEQLREESSALEHVEIESEDDPINIFDTEENKKLIIKKYLGHKPVEVFAGVLTGIIMAFILRMFY
jgi:membrane protein